MSDGHFDEQTVGGVAASLAASAAGMATGLAFAGPPGAAAGALTGPALQALINYFGLRLERARSKAARVLADGAAQADLTEDKLIEIAMRSPQKVELVAEAVDAAARSTAERKLNALASALARGVTGDDYAAARERLTVGALAALEPIHLAVMACLASRPPMYHSEEEWNEVMRNPPDNAHGWLVIEVTKKLPDVESVAEVIFADLQRYALIVDTAIGTIDYQPRYVITGFGQRCLTWLGNQVT